MSEQLEKLKKDINVILGDSGIREREKPMHVREALYYATTGEEDYPNDLLAYVLHVHIGLSNGLDVYTAT